MPVATPSPPGVTSESAPVTPACSGFPAHVTLPASGSLLMFLPSGILLSSPEEKTPDYLSIGIVPSLALPPLFPLNGSTVALTVLEWSFLTHLS